MNAEDVLHDVNNQLEIVIGAAGAIRNQSENANSKERCALIESAVYKISACLNSYFKTLIAAEREQGESSHHHPRVRKQFKPAPLPETPLRTSR